MPRNELIKDFSDAVQAVAVVDGYKVKLYNVLDDVKSKIDCKLPTNKALSEFCKMKVRKLIMEARKKRAKLKGTKK